MPQLRGIRSDALRALAAQALGQGFRLDRSGSDHLALVSPSGSRVWFSTTKNAKHHSVANVRSALVRAGFQTPERLRRAAATDRHLAAQAALREASTMPEPTPTNPIEPVRRKPASHHGRSHRPAGGAYAWVHFEDLEIEGVPVLYRERGDGLVYAAMTDHRLKSGRKQWGRKDGDRDALLAQVRAHIVETNAEAPTVPTNGHAAPDADDPLVYNPFLTDAEATAEAEAQGLTPRERTYRASTDGTLAGREYVDEPVAVPVETGGGSIWAAVNVDPDEYPLARALADLDRVIGPAVAALEAAGKGDAAALVRGELGRSPVEEELLRLWREVFTSRRAEPEA